MSNLEFMWNLENISKVIEFIKLNCIILISIYIFVKISGTKKINFLNIIIYLLTSPIIVLTKNLIEYNVDAYLSWIVILALITFINIINLKNDIYYTLSISIISFSLSYIMYIISISLVFIPTAILKLNNDYMVLIMIEFIQFLLVYKFFKIKKFKYGISFLERKSREKYFIILILNIGLISLFALVTIKSYSDFSARKFGATFVLLILTMFTTIKQFFDIYYKQKLLIQDLKQTKKELEEKKQEISKLEKENIEFSKTSHSLAHKQKALEFKLEQLIKNCIDKESKETIKEEIENVSKEVFKEPNKVKLAKTEIESIDNMFSYMQSECIRYNIKFELQVVGNIYYMINNLITENDLEILIADHIKDAIIAINNSDNLNRSILVRLGKIDNVYSLYIYDSGIEFTKEVLDNIGKRPITTHADTGGTGMGFMNTFDTLNKTKASLIINEIGVPCEDNYTKVLIFKFDKQNQFEVESYKNKVLV